MGSICHHWLQGATRCESPNYSERPEDMSPWLLVIHNISLPPGEYGGQWIQDLFCNCLDPDAHPYFAGIADLKVSAHALIRRDGEVIQFVPFDKKAWHAGQSSYEGFSACNDFSIGIELEGCDSEPFTDAQYHSLIELTRTLLMSYPSLTQKHITGHSDIAPGRKTDPGPCFDWDRYRAALV